MMMMMVPGRAQRSPTEEQEGSVSPPKLPRGLPELTVRAHLLLLLLPPTPHPTQPRF